MPIVGPEIQEKNRLAQQNTAQINTPIKLGIRQTQPKQEPNDITPSNSKTISNEELNKALAEKQETKEAEPSRLEEIAKDWKYAKLSTWAMYVTTLLSWFNPNKASSRSFEQQGIDTSPKAGLFNKIQDFFLRIRMMGQMTLHADPGNQKIIGDDIVMSNLHNITAQKFGSSAYKFHAFWSPWSWLLQHVFFTGTHSFSKPINALIKAFDRSMRLVTNMFWNLRRVTLGLVPYVNNELLSMSSPNSEVYKKLREASKPVRNTMQQWSILLAAHLHQTLNKFIPRPIMNFLEHKLNFNMDRLRAAHRKARKENINISNPIDAILKIVIPYAKANLEALKTGKHKSILSGELQDLRIEEPHTPGWYLKSKLLANVLNPWVGIGSFAINLASMATGIAGELLRNKTTSLLSLSQNLMDTANGAMSAVYMLGEVFGHAATVQRNYKNGDLKLANIGTFGIGLLGMGWRIVKGMAAALAIPGMVIKPLGTIANKILHSRLDNFLEPLFLLFFSVNRDDSLRNSYKAELSTAGHEERKAAEKHNRVSEVITMPLKILTHDKAVTYDHPEAVARAETLAAS